MGKLIYQWGDLTVARVIYQPIFPILRSSLCLGTCALTDSHILYSMHCRPLMNWIPPSPIHPSLPISRPEALFLWQLLFITTVATHIWTILPMPGEQFESTPVNQLYIGSYSRVESGILWTMLWNPYQQSSRTNPQISTIGFRNIKHTSYIPRIFPSIMVVCFLPSLLATPLQNHALSLISWAVLMLKAHQSTTLAGLMLKTQMFHGFSW